MFFKIGLLWNGIAALFLAACVIFVAFFYGDHLGKMFFILDQHKALSLARNLWHNALERNQSFTRVLGVTAFLLVLLSILGQVSRFLLEYALFTELAPLFYVDIEHNIPTYFSVILILLAALLLAVIARTAQKQKTLRRSKWVILSCGFLLMAFDEAFQYHERLNIPVGRLLSDGSLGVFYFPWVIPGIVLVFVLGLYFLKFLLHLPSAIKFRFIMAATLYIGDAIGVELIGSQHAELYGYDNLTYG